MPHSLLIIFLMLKGPIDERICSTITSRSQKILCMDQDQDPQDQIHRLILFVPFGLQKLLDRFGILDEKKSDFPHLMNRIELEAPQELW